MDVNTPRPEKSAGEQFLGQTLTEAIAGRPASLTEVIEEEELAG